MIKTLLIANRGEIARRVIRTARRLGIATVAVHSDPDADALFVREADAAVSLGGASPSESYLRIESVIKAALESGADAVHPGYGFLSENADFARAVTAAGLTWVGPSPEAMEAMGSKLAARNLMISHGVPVLPGRDLTGVDDEAVAEAADEVGWPVLVKASAGGGGRGMRLVRERGELAAAVGAARREAASAFGDPTVFLEHYVDDPRHIEIQIFGDTHGNVVHLFERECSIQRRHQKIIEEAPSPAIDDALRQKMGAAAVAAGRAIDYVGAGTVEFVAAPNGDFYFLEVNTRLQVEHPVTEEVTGLDLVALQLTVAEGRPLPDRVRQASLRGHSIEVRLYAEDALAGYLPATGLLSRFEIPEGEGIRLETGVRSGDRVSPNYDPMLAKVIASADTRDEALRRLSATLRRARVHGVTTNLGLLLAVLEDEEFTAGRFDTHFLERKPPARLVGSLPDLTVDVHAVAAALAEQAASRRSAPLWAAAPAGWRNNRGEPQVRAYRHGERVIEIGYWSDGPHTRVAVDGAEAAISPGATAPDSVELTVEGVRRRYVVFRDGDIMWVESPLATVELRREPRFPEPEVVLSAGSLVAPMPGIVVRVEAAEGDDVEAGQVLLMLEAMKMEHPVRSPVSGILASLKVQAGQNVDAGTVLAVIDEEVK